MWLLQFESGVLVDAVIAVAHSYLQRDVERRLRRSWYRVGAAAGLAESQAAVGQLLDDADVRCDRQSFVRRRFHWVIAQFDGRARQHPLERATHPHVLAANEAHS